MIGLHAFSETFFQFKAGIDDVRDAMNIYLQKKPGTVLTELIPYAYVIGTILLVSLLGFFIIYFFKRSRKYKTDMKIFARYCEEKNLTFRQAEILKQLAKKYKYLPSYLITSRMELSDIAVKESNALRKENPDNKALIANFEQNMQSIIKTFDHRKPKQGEILYNSRDIHVGKTVILFQKSRTVTYPTKGIIVQMDNEHFLVKTKIPKNEASPLLDAQKIFVFLAHENDAYYEFETTILKRQHHKEGSDEVFFLSLAHVDRMSRKQRRRYIRVRVNLPVFVDKEFTKDKTKYVPVNLNMIDISEDGCFLRSESRIDSNTIVNMHFKLEHHDISNVLAKILYSNKTGDIYFYHLQFIDIKDDSRSLIKQYVHNHTKRKS